MPIIKCKCGVNTTFGLTCVFCNNTFLLDPEVEKDEAESLDEESGFHEVQLDENLNEIFEED